MEKNKLLKDELEFDQINKVYDECLSYLKQAQVDYRETLDKIIIDKFVDEQPTRVDLNNQHNIGQLENGQVSDPNYEMLDNVKRNAFVVQPVPINENNPNNRENLQNGDLSEPYYESIIEGPRTVDELSNSFIYEMPEANYKIENEINPEESEIKSENPMIKAVENEAKSERLRKLSQQLPRIIITQSDTSLDMKKDGRVDVKFKINNNKQRKKPYGNIPPRQQQFRQRAGYGDFPHRLMCKNGLENVALISNVPYEKIRMLNDTFHTLINLRWRWIVSGTIVLHFGIWLVFAVFWYVAALAHYDFEPDPPARSCVTGGKDFVTIFLASVEAQTTIGFGDRTIDEECPESIFLFIMQLILGTGLSGVLTCVVYAKLTRPEKMTRDGVGFSKKAVISMRDGQLCLMIRAWDLNHDHIIGSDFTAHFVKTHRTQEGEVIRYFARSLELQERQFLLWPITLVHVIDETSPLYGMTPHHVANNSYEITVSLKGASASMGTFTQSQTSYLPKEVVWGFRFPPVVKYDSRKQKYVIEHKKLDLIEPIETPQSSASQLFSNTKEKRATPPPCPGTPSSFGDRMTSFHLERSSSFRSTKNESKA